MATRTPTGERATNQKSKCALGTGITRIVSSAAGGIGDSVLQRYDDDAEIHRASRG